MSWRRRGAASCPSIAQSEERWHDSGPMEYYGFISLRQIVMHVRCNGSKKLNITYVLTIMKFDESKLRFYGIRYFPYCEVLRCTRPMHRERLISSHNILWTMIPARNFWTCREYLMYRSGSLVSLHEASRYLTSCACRTVLDFVEIVRCKFTDWSSSWPWNLVYLLLTNMLTLPVDSY